MIHSTVLTLNKPGEVQVGGGEGGGDDDLGGLGGGNGGGAEGVGEGGGGLGGGEGGGGGLEGPLPAFEWSRRLHGHLHRRRDVSTLFARFGKYSMHFCRILGFCMLKAGIMVSPELLRLPPLTLFAPEDK